MGDFERARTHMVDNQLRTNDVTDHGILDAMGKVPRERFVPASKRCIAYSDSDIPLSLGDTQRYLMKPHVFAKLVQLAGVRKDDVVLCVGCATGEFVGTAGAETCKACPAGRCPSAARSLAAPCHRPSLRGSEREDSAYDFSRRAVQQSCPISPLLFFSVP